MLFYIRSVQFYRRSLEDSQDWKKHHSKNSELDSKSQKNKITKAPEYIDKIQQFYYLERWCRW